MTILIGGGSCSGKTTFTNALVKHLKATPINLDKFFRRDDPNAPTINLNGKIFFDCNHPQTVDITKALAEIYQTTNPKIVEGHFALTYPELRDLASLKVFVDCPDETRQSRRLARDTANQRGTPEEILAYYRASAIPGFQKHIEPSKQHANLIISGENPPEQNIQIILNELK